MAAELPPPFCDTEPPDQVGELEEPLPSDQASTTVLRTSYGLYEGTALLRALEI
jgi:hypothetical protein